MVAWIGMPPELAAQNKPEKDVSLLLKNIADDLRQSGPLGWLPHFSTGPRFFMASDGKVVFANFDAAETFLKDFATRVSHMEIRWSDVRVRMIGQDAALVAAAYDETINQTSGKSKQFRGYFSGLAIRQQAGWKLGHLHWSSPRPDPDHPDQ
jgi:ketosteroid isomerase-like protein